MSIFDRLASYFGYTKAQVDNAPTWLRATANAQRFNVPEPWLATNQLELYQRLSWVSIAVGAVASTAATAALNVRELEGEQALDIPNHPFEMTLMRPNPLQSRYEFIEATFMDRALTGNAYWWLNRSNANQPPAEIWTIPPNRIRPVPDGNLYLRGYLYDPGDGTEMPLEPWEIVHFKRYHPLNPFVGLSPIEALATTAAGDLAMQKWNTNFFAEDNAKVPGALAFADPIDEGRWQAMKADIREQHGGTKRNMMMLRNVGKGGVQWVSMAMSQKDMEFLAARNFNREEIYAMFAPGLASVLAINATEANSDAGKKTFLDLAVWPQMVAVAEKITNDVLPAYGDRLVAEFDDIRITDRVLLLQEQGAFSQVHTVDEIRARYYQAEPLGDERGRLLLAEVAKAAVTPVTSTDGAMQATALAVEPATVAEPALNANEPSPVDDEPDLDAVKAAELKALRKWAKKRKSPRAEDFRSEVLSLAEIKAELGEADEGTPFFTLWTGNSIPDAVASIKAMVLQLDPDDPEAEQRARDAVERDAAENLTDALEKQRRALIPANSPPTNAGEVVGRVEETSGTVRDALRRAIVASSDLGVSVSVRQLERIGYGFDWTLVNTDAREWANRYSGELITRINDTTRNQVRQAVGEWIENGEPLSALVRELSSTTFSEQRASLIAATEVTRSYAEANRLAYERTGVIGEIEWRASNDERVCPVCGPLHGTRSPVNQPDFDGLGLPPAHPNCRCWIVPVVSDIRPQEVAPPVDAEPVAAEGRTAESARQELGARFTQRPRQLRLLEEEYDTAAKQYQQSLDEYMKLSAAREPREVLLVKYEEVTNLYQRTQEIQNRNAEAKAQFIAEARKVVQVDSPSSVKLNLVSKFKKDDPRLVEFETGKAEFEKLVGVMPNGSTIDVKAGGKGRSSYSVGQNTMNITTGTGSKTIVHEMGHWWEDIDPTVHEKALAFLERRTEGEAARKLKDIYPGAGYRPSEITKKDKFEHAYTGKIYMYRGEQVATEIVSMGLESMYKDPASFAQSDPDFFDFIYNLARGQ